VEVQIGKAEGGGFYLGRVIPPLFPRLFAAKPNRRFRVHRRHGYLLPGSTNRRTLPGASAPERPEIKTTERERRPRKGFAKDAELVRINNEARAARILGNAAVAVNLAQ
jgi:hypothetical protein